MKNLPLDIQAHEIVCGVVAVADDLKALLDALPLSFAEKHREALIAKVRHLESIEASARDLHVRLKEVV